MTVLYIFFFWSMKEEQKCLSKKEVRRHAAKSLQSCPTLCDPIDGSPPGSPVPGILQAKTLEWVAISFSNAWKWKVKGKSLNRARLFATPWTAAHQAPPPMGLSRQEYWSGVPLLSPKISDKNSQWGQIQIKEKHRNCSKIQSPLYQNDQVHIVSWGILQTFKSS